MLKKKGLPPVSGEVVILTLCLVLVLITLSQILVVHHKFNGRYTKVVRSRGPRARHELRQLERSLASLMRQKVPSMRQHSEQLRTEVFAKRISQLINRSAREVLAGDRQTALTAHPFGPTGGLQSRAFIATSSANPHNLTGNPVCAVVPSSLTGPVSVNVSHSHDDITLSAVIRDNKQIEYGGKWQPSVCRARHRVALVIPYRDRLQHLAVLLAHLLPVLRRQQLNFRVFVVEQSGNGTFNKGRIMNAAFKEALKLYDFQCIVFHDVDLVPEDDRNMYTCPWQPRHMSVAIDEHDYRLKYDILVGGVLNMRTEHYERVNGYSNMYWGWGAEDDDMAYRILHVGLKISRPPSTLARYKMIKHQKRRPAAWITRSKLLHTAVKRYKLDGLNSIKYKLMFIHEETLFTHIMVDVGTP